MQLRIWPINIPLLLDFLFFELLEELQSLVIHDVHKYFNCSKFACEVCLLSSIHQHSVVSK